MKSEHAEDTHGLHNRSVTVNGNVFRVLVQGDGPAVLFCHGFPDTAATWRRQMKAVANAGYQAIALDMRGFGRSYAPADFHLYTSLHVVGDLIGILDALKVPEAVIVGHDWGADYAQRACVMRPDRFRALVSISIPFAPRGDQSLWDDLRARALGDRYYAFALSEAEADARLLPAADTIRSALYWLSGSPPADQRWDPIDPELGMLRPAPRDLPDWVEPDHAAETIEAFERTGFHTGLNYYRVLQETFDLTAAFKGASLSQPSLYIWGRADGLCRFFHPELPTVDDLRPVWPGLVDIVALDEVGHWPQHEASQRVNGVIIDFLERLDGNHDA